MTDNTLEKRLLYVFNKKGGKIVKCIEGTGRGMVGLWAFQNTTKSRVAVLTLADGQIERIYIGNEDYPNVKYIHKTEFLIDMDNYIVDEQHLNVNQLLTDLAELGL